jgi:hypothetical protein
MAEPEMTAHVIWTLSTLPSAASALQSSISALERDITVLESQSSRLEPWLGWFTLLVAIGVALEIFVVIHDHRKELSEWRVSELIPEGPSLIKLGIEIASIILIIAGVMGEFGAGLKISSINGQLRAKSAELRSKSDQLLALVTQEAGDAKTSAEGAAVAASRAKDSSNEASQTAGVAKALASEAKSGADRAATKAQSTEEQTEKVRQQANALGAVNAAEDKRAIEIIRSMEPRALSYTARYDWKNGDGESDSLDELKPFAGTKVIFEVLPDVEARRAALEIEHVLTFAHWEKVGLSLNPELFWGFNDGVRIEYGLNPEMGHPGSALRAGDKSPQAADVLAFFLMKQGWYAHATSEFNTTDRLPINTIKIVVGFKPNPLFEPWIEEYRQEEIRSRQEMEDLKTRIGIPKK